MQRLRTLNLKVGEVYSQSLFTSTGQKLLNAGVPLTERHLDAITRSGEMSVLVAQDVQELVDAGVLNHFDADQLKVGQKLDQQLVTTSGQVLLEPGQEVEEHHLDALRETPGTFVSREAAASQRRERILMADALVEDLLAKVKEMPTRVAPDPQTRWLRPGDPSAWLNPADLAKWRQGEVEALRKLYANIEAGNPVQVAQFEPILQNLMDRLIKYPTRFTQLALLCPRREDYLPDHAYTVTVLAMSIGAQLHWPLDHVRELGLAGLVFDLGMLLVPERIRSGASVLSDIDRGRVQRHSLFTLSMLQVVQTVHPIIQLAALQHHERENGGGYPLGTRRENICDYARVLATADTFAAITEPRSYRKQKMPYMAMEETIRTTTANSLWKPAVRGLLQAAGLFPVGSFVKLSSGKHAHVISANPRQLDRPCVQPLDATGNVVGAPIDLAHVHPDELSVVRPIAGPTG